MVAQTVFYHGNYGWFKLVGGDDGRLVLEERPIGYPRIVVEPDGKFYRFVRMARKEDGADPYHYFEGRYYTSEWQKKLDEASLLISDRRTAIDECRQRISTIEDWVPEGVRDTGTRLSLGTVLHVRLYKDTGGEHWDRDLMVVEVRENVDGISYMLDTEEYFHRHDGDILVHLDPRLGAYVGVQTDTELDFDYPPSVETKETPLVASADGANLEHAWMTLYQGHEDEMVAREKASISEYENSIAYWEEKVASGRAKGII